MSNNNGFLLNNYNFRFSYLVQIYLVDIVSVLINHVRQSRSSPPSLFPNNDYNFLNGFVSRIKIASMQKQLKQLRNKRAEKKRNDSGISRSIRP